MMKSILPTEVRWSATTNELADEPLFPAEERYIADAVDRRRHEFTTVRWCARQALAELGVARPSLVPGHRGAPGWPVGVVGSMTHCAGYRAAAVARTDDVALLGIDAEPDVSLPDGVLDAVTGAWERKLLDDLAQRRPEISWDRLLFSAKESVYKAWFPVRGTMLDFADAILEPSVDGAFTALLVGSARGDPLGPFHGRWASNGKHVTTAVVRPRRGVGLPA